VRSWRTPDGVERLHPPAAEVTAASEYWGGILPVGLLHSLQPSLWAIESMDGGVAAAGVGANSAVTMSLFADAAGGNDLFALAAAGGEVAPLSCTGSEVNTGFATTSGRAGEAPLPLVARVVVSLRPARLSMALEVANNSAETGPATDDSVPTSCSLDVDFRVRAHCSMATQSGAAITSADTVVHTTGHTHEQLLSGLGLGLSMEGFGAAAVVGGAQSHCLCLDVVPAPDGAGLTSLAPGQAVSGELALEVLQVPAASNGSQIEIDPHG